MYIDFIIILVVLFCFKMISFIMLKNVKLIIVIVLVDLILIVEVELNLKCN